ncbi:SAM-dependent methyltransferase [Sphingomonas oryzagri]|uniref:SAM-dependent methyltransferase n=1 Tax=Sphingomonas oryzagri TaxID=3042314 RepID=A0ABT6MYM4_9SPHN|nr:SAM-dependent methyltransferase [Sphingomonas oryzagri]MDH7638153.1 SAM-dependent methyltransferase [Sphingomonas oryzagri]
MTIASSSLDAAYFEGIFEGDDDPWDLATSEYESRKFDATMEAIAGRRYARALEVGCAQGVLTERLVTVCDELVSIDISPRALSLALKRVGDRPGLSLKRMAFPKEAPEETFDLVVLSEVAYYWGVVDLDRASEWLQRGVAAGGRILLVHYTGETDYPHSADEAVETLWADLKGCFEQERSDRHDRYRLDLWRRM